MKEPKFKVGDTVVYNRVFLQNIGAYTGWMPRAKGKIVEIGRLTNQSPYLYSIEFVIPGESELWKTKVIEPNLSRASKKRGIEENV